MSCRAFGRQRPPSHATWRVRGYRLNSWMSCSRRVRQDLLRGDRAIMDGVRDVGRLTVELDVSSGTRCGTTRMSVSDRYLSGSHQTTSAVSDGDGHERGEDHPLPAPAQSGGYRRASTFLPGSTGTSQKAQGFRLRRRLRRTRRSASREGGQGSSTDSGTYRNNGNPEIQAQRGRSDGSNHGPPRPAAPRPGRRRSGSSYNQPTARRTC